MRLLNDANLISEVCKGDLCDPDVTAWRSGGAEDDLWLSPWVLGEIRKEVELARRHDLPKAEALQAWFADVVSGFGDRVLPVDAAVAEKWGRMNAIRSVSIIDALLNAAAKVHGLPS